jgi:pilus assembly protein CpaE
MFNATAPSSIAKDSRTSTLKVAPPLQAGTARVSKLQPVIGILGAKGGVGATTLSINLALAFSQICGRATLVDADLQQPDVAASLDLHSAYSLLDIVNRSQPSDADVLQTCTTAIHESSPNCRLLAPPRHGEAHLSTNLTIVSACLRHLNQESALWLIDLPRHLDKHLVTIMDMCDQILLIFEPSVTAVNSAQRWLGTFEDLAYDRRKISLVLNRSGGRSKGVEEQLGRVFSNAGICRIPNAYSLVEKCNAAGEPALARHGKEPYSLSVFGLAQATVRQLEMLSPEEHR